MLTPEELEIVRLSVKVALVSVAISVPFGVAVAYALARWQFPGKSLFDALVHLPLVLPPVVVGYWLLLLFGRRAPLGRQRLRRGPPPRLDRTQLRWAPGRSAGVANRAAFDRVGRVVVAGGGGMAARDHAVDQRLVDVDVDDVGAVRQHHPGPVQDDIIGSGCSAVIERVRCQVEYAHHCRC